MRQKFSLNLTRWEFPVFHVLCRFAASTRGYLKRILIIGTAVGCVFAGTLPVYTETERTIKQGADQPLFVIQLKSNPTTGYSWFLEPYDHKFIQLVEHWYVPSKKTLAGAGGTEQWQFQLTKEAFTAPHTLFIKLSYRRPWETQPASKSVVFEIKTAATPS